MPSVGFETTISASERPQTYALEWDQQIKELDQTQAKQAVKYFSKERSVDWSSIHFPSYSLAPSDSARQVT